MKPYDKGLAIVFFMGFLTMACASGTGIQSISAPAVQGIAYKDIVASKNLDDVPGFSDCQIKDPKSGITVVLRIQTSQIPQAPAE